MGCCSPANPDSLALVNRTYRISNQLAHVGGDIQKWHLQTPLLYRCVNVTIQLGLSSDSWINHPRGRSDCVVFYKCSKFTRFRNLKTNVRKRPFWCRAVVVCARHSLRVRQTIYVRIPSPLWMGLLWLRSHAPPIGLTGFCGLHRVSALLRVKGHCVCKSVANVQTILAHSKFLWRKVWGRVLRSCGCVALRETPLHIQFARRTICNWYGVPFEYATALSWWAQACKARGSSGGRLVGFAGLRMNGVHFWWVVWKNEKKCIMDKNGQGRFLLPLPKKTQKQWTINN